MTTDNQMTRQEMFNKAYLGVMAQGSASYSQIRKACVYRGPNGTACGVGHLLDDETAALFDAQDYSAIDDIVNEVTGEENGDTALAEQIPAFVFRETEFLVFLQCAHDCAQSRTAENPDTFLEVFAARMREVADKYGLTVPDAPPQ